jgi:hypothetical protein
VERGIGPSPITADILLARSQASCLDVSHLNANAASAVSIKTARAMSGDLSRHEPGVVDAGHFSNKHRFGGVHPESF